MTLRPHHLAPFSIARHGLSGNRRRLVVALLALAIPLADLQAQWAVQDIPLNPGWNAVYFEVQPEPRSCDELFAGLPIESVWLWNRRFSSVEFIQDPASLVPGQPDWLVWLPPGSEARPAQSLHSVLGGRAYLIQVATSSPGLTLPVRGTPTLRPPDWQSDSLNLIGFTVNAQEPPTFSAFFAGSAAHIAQPMYQLNTAGHWEVITQPATMTIESGRAYWIGALGPSSFAGPIEVRLPQSTGLDYGSALSEVTLAVRNTSSQARSLRIRLLQSAAPPIGSYPPLAGEVPLAYFHMDLAVGQYRWLPLNTDLERLDLPPGAEWPVRLEIRRTEMVPNTDPDARYQSLLEITDDRGTRILVPVVAQGPLVPSAASPSGIGLLDDASIPHRHAGLWIGDASVGRVSQPAHISQPNAPQPVAAPFQFRLIVHVDAEGRARLLQKVLQMWKDGTTKSDPLDPNRQVVDVPGRFVLLTDESLAPAYFGAALRDGEPVGRRVSSAAFSFANPLSLTGDGEFGDGTISCLIPLTYDDPLNPFVHRYHPDHNNLDERFEAKLPASVESFTISRQVSLQFTPQPPDDLALAGWGDTQLGGLYRETISGVHRQPIHVEGHFRLQKASAIPTLNDQN